MAPARHRAGGMYFVIDIVDVGRVLVEQHRAVVVLVADHTGSTADTVRFLGSCSAMEGMEPGVCLQRSAKVCSLCANWVEVQGV